MGKKPFRLSALKPTESQIEILVGHYLAYEKVFFWKAQSVGFFSAKEGKFRRQYNPYSLNGVPDYCLVIEGRFYGWELKSESGKQSPNQKVFENRLGSEGKAPYAIIRSLEDAKRELGKIRGLNKFIPGLKP